MSPADFGLNSGGTLFGISGPAIPARPDPVCGIAHTKIFFLLRERCPPGGVAPLLAPKTKQVNTSAGRRLPRASAAVASRRKQSGCRATELLPDGLYSSA
jgi:hypothetical protein